MVKILLCCSAGMSTSLFVQKTQAYAQEIDQQIDIKAISLDELESHLTDDVSLVVLAPQIKFQKEKVEGQTNKPIMVIDMRDYGMMNVQKVLPEMLEMIKSS